MFRALLSMLIALTLVVAGPGEWVLLACSMGGSLGEPCCCEHDEAPNAGTHITSCSDGCCDVQVVKATPMPFDSGAEFTQLPGTPIVQTTPYTPPPRRLARTTAQACPQARAPPHPPDAPIYIEVCSFLI